MSFNAMMPSGNVDKILMQNYPSNINGYDEVMDADGGIRSHWQQFIAGFSHLNSEDQQQLSEKLRRLVYENGLAHNVFADPDHVSQAWSIDLIPMVISSQEWAWLAKAVKQRAMLSNEILKDIYGSQSLLKKGAIPPRLIYSDKSFLKPCMNLGQDHPPLYFFAVDVARNRDGSWRVIDCHAETPAGLGFAIANRIVHTKVLGDIFESCNIQREASYFQGILQDMPIRIGVSDPRIVILSPGLQHGDYFSHAYLARYMGYRLVEGSDLQVVGDDIFLKTLSGLMPVDGIIRCIDGELADPLELNPNGFLGPSGFVQALRKNPAMCANSPGSGVIENRGLGAYIPDLCKSILGEDLLLQDADRLWLGDDADRRKVLENINDYLIHPAREGTGRPGIAETGRKFSGLGEAEKKIAVADIRLKGDNLVAEKESFFSTTPSWSDGELKPTPYAMRLFAVRRGDDYELLPGGLAMNINPEVAVAMNAPKGMARDVWIPDDNSVAPYRSLLTPYISTKDIDRNSSHLPSRIADNLFWLGRYVERAEWTMRLMRSAVIQAEEERGLAPDVDAIRKTLEILITKDGSSIRLPDEGQGPDQINTLIRILRSSNVGTFGLKGTLERILHVAQLIRDRLSLEAWQALNSFNNNPLWWEDVVPIRNDDSIDLLNEGIRTLAAFSGIVTENMTRNYGWRFLEIGRRLERALNHCEVLQMLFVERADEQHEASRLFFILKLADSLITYRSRYRFAPDISLVLDLLIIDESNPRGLCFQLQEISEHINALPKSSDDAVRTDEQKITLDLNTQARLADMEKLVSVDKNGIRNELQKLLEEQINNLPVLSEVLSRRYFSLMDSSPVRVHTHSEQS